MSYFEGNVTILVPIMYLVAYYRPEFQVVHEIWSIVYLRLETNEVPEIITFPYEKAQIPNSTVKESVIIHYNLYFPSLENNLITAKILVWQAKAAI